MELLYSIVLISSLLAILSLASSVISFRYGAPLLLLFLLVGLLAGVSGIGGTHFSNPQTVFIIGSIALATILFESGFTTSWHSYRLAAWPAIAMATAGVLITAAIMMITGIFLLDMHWLQAAFLGAVLCSTDAAAVFFLLRVGRITIRERVRSTLEIESGTNDPMAIMLVLVLAQIATMFNVTGAAVPPTYLDVIFHLLMELAIGGVAGYVGGRLIVVVINKLNFETSLYPLISLVIALFVFALAGILGGSGFLAIYVAGLVAGNSRLRNSQNVRKFHEGISWLSQLTMFLILGLMADLNQLLQMALPALGVAFVLIFIARPVATYACLWPFKFTPAETSFVAWVGLRGAVSILLALLPIMAGIESSQMIFTVTFLVVIYSLIIQGWTIKGLAKGLNLIVPPQTGPVKRVEFELSMDSNLELVAYDVHPESLIAQNAPLPSWSRPVLIIRNGQPIPVADNSVKPQPYDQIYFFTNPSRLPVFDRLLGAPLSDYESERQFYGDVILEPNVKFSEIANIYSLKIEDVDPDMALAELFKQEFQSGYEVGDRIRLGRFEFIIRTIEEDEIRSVGLALMAPGLRDQIIDQVSPVKSFVERMRGILSSSRKRSAKK